MSDTPALISNTTVWSRGRWLPGRDVHLADGRVARVVPHDARRAPEGAVLDGAGGHLVPGLVNTHTHLHQSIMRGIAEGEPLIRWLRYVAEGTVALTPEQAYVAAAAASLEALRSGTTALVEHMWPHPSREVHDAVLRALDDTGIRAVVCRGVADRPDATRKWGFEPRLMEPLDEVLAHIDALAARTAGGRIGLGVAVPNPRSLTPEGLRRVRAFAEERAMTASIHLLETATDEDMCREHAGVGAVAYLEDAGFLWDRLLAVHCCKLDAAGREALAAHGTGVSYNPLSNMRLGSGVAPVPEMLAAGLRVGLGVDGAASNDTQDALETMRMGAYLQRAVHGRSDLLGFADMIGLATSGANAVLGLEERPDGVVPGVQADLALLRFDRDLACVPVLDPGATLLTTGSSRTVDTVLVDGEVLIADGRSTRLDERALIERALAAAPDPAVLRGPAG
ncbi:amidohydrolase family protein [Actinomadura parmotrematis]|uniref:Amidohydrolase family protein n=1 Tax=Actinomadura parmotrematis TaxID=2864039 RepID=A0ABS7G4K3_9ACTN|nr:amidohydrolase family protein [Actinomadura parmotrematis]MBW8487657.1 amidohydrolase family protein [Actinomadura parmotrematis]